jgi:serine/threonine-protein kinase
LKERGRFFEGLVKTHFGPFVFDPSNQLLWRGGQEVPLPPRVVGVLGQLVARPGEVVSRQELIDSVWKDAFVSDTSLAEAISFLRQALGDDPQQPSYIQTIHRRGYRFLQTPHLDTLASPERAPDPASRGDRAGDRASRGVSAGDPWSLVLPWAVAALLGVVAGTSVWRLAHPDAGAAQPVARFDVALPLDTVLDVDARAIAWSPGGARLAFVACASEGCRLFIRGLDDPRVRALAGTDGAAAPFFSPDETWIGFFADGKLKKVAFAGGMPVALADARLPLGGAWLGDGTIVFASALVGGLQRVSASGGQPRSATDLDVRAGELRHEQPEAVAGSRTLLMTAVVAPGSPLRARVVAVSLDSGQRAILVEHASAPRFVAPNVLTFVRNGDLMAAAFDPLQLKVVGQPVVVVAGVGDDPGQYAVSRAGTLAIPSGPATVIGPATAAATVPPTAPVLAIVAARGSPLDPLPHVFQHLWSVSLSTDGTRVAGVKAVDEPGELWWGTVDRGTLARLTFDGEHRDPIWTWDGRGIVFASRVEGAFNIFTRAIDGTAGARRVTTSTHHQTPGAITADGTVVFTEFDPATGADIWSVPIVGGAPRAIVRTPFDEMSPAVSPDGRWLAYQSNESNRWEVYIRPLAGAGAAVPISAGGGTSPVWSADGRTLTYAGRSGVMSVSLACRAALSGSPEACDLAPSTPLEIVRGPWIPRGRALVERARGRVTGVDHLSVTLQWTRELQRILPPAVVNSPK